MSHLRIESSKLSQFCRAAGAKDNGGPGLRKYTPTYYAAYVLDVHGNNIEALHM